MDQPIGTEIEPGTEVVISEMSLDGSTSRNGVPKSVIVLRDDQNRFGIKTNPLGSLGLIAILRDRHVGVGGHLDVPVDREPKFRVTVIEVRKLSE